MGKNRQPSNAQELLLEYRPTVWRKNALESISGTGRKSLQACVEQIYLTHALVEMLRSNELLGEKLYRIIHASYMTDRQPHNIEETLSVIANEYEHIPRRTYFRLKVRAVKMMDEFLLAKQDEGSTLFGNAVFYPKNPNLVAK